MGCLIRLRFYFSPNQFLGEVLSSESEGPQKREVYLSRCTRGYALL